MDNNEKLYTLLVYSENTPGLLSQITAIFTRRQVNIESLNVCSSSVPGIHKYTITCVCTEEMVKMLRLQMEKRIDVLQAKYYIDEELFILEGALIKVSTPTMLKNPEISHIIRVTGGHIVEVNPTYCIVEKIGRTSTILSLYEQLKEIGAVLQFTRTGRICVTRSHEEHLFKFLEKRAAAKARLEANSLPPSQSPKGE